MLMPHIRPTAGLPAYHVSLHSPCRPRQGLFCDLNGLEKSNV
jgi:hypothetical protein